VFAGYLKKLHYQKLFLFGAYTVIMLLVLPASIIDYLIGSYEDVAIDLAFGLVTLAAFVGSFKKDKTDRAGIWLFWIATVFDYIYLLAHDVDFDLNLLLAAFLAYIYISQPVHPYIHNSRFLLALAVSHGFIIAYGVFYAMSIDESIKRLEESDRAKSILLAEVHHRVKNNLNLVASILGIQAQRKEGSEAGQMLENNRRRIESMAILHEVLYRNNQINKIDLQTYLEMLVDHIVQTEAIGNVKINAFVVPIRLPIDRMIQIGIMLNEMVTNSIKYAADKEGNALIDIRFESADEGYLLRYCDHGSKVDIPKLKQGFGYSLIEMTAEHLRGEMHISSEHGLCYTVRFRHMEDTADER